VLAVLLSSVQALTLTDYSQCVFLRTLDCRSTWNAALLQEKRQLLLAKSAAMVAPNLVLPMKHELRLNAITAEHELTIEATAPIFCVAVMSTAKATFLEAVGTVAILTQSAAPQWSTAQSLATYRCGQLAGMPFTA
jgi:hypothetical protein